MNALSISCIPKRPQILLITEQVIKLLWYHWANSQNARQITEPFLWISSTDTICMKLMFTNLNQFRMREKRSRSLHTILKREISRTAPELTWKISETISTELTRISEVHNTLQFKLFWPVWGSPTWSSLFSLLLLKFVEINYTYVNN